MPQTLHLFSARMLFIVVSLLVSTSNQVPTSTTTAEPTYEMTYSTDATTETTGSIVMCCRSSETAEELPLNEVHFWFNRTRVCDPSLRDQSNIRVIEVDNHNIKFNLTRSHEGYYTCGKRVSVNHVMESSPKALTCKQIAA